MDDLTKQYFEKAYTLLGKWLTPSKDELLARYHIYPDECTCEEINGYHYFLFCYPLVNIDKVELLEQGILLVFDHDTIIADLAFMHGSMNAIMKSKQVYDEITTDSDWSFLQYYTLCNFMFPEKPYPYCFHNTNDDFPGETAFFTNAYVTKSYRKKGFFTNMLEISKEQVLRNEVGKSVYYSVFSLDPDVACYGPDTLPEPYVYTMADEANRMRNKAILEKFHYNVIRLEETEPDEESDGTKLWFAVAKENENIIETMPM